MIWIGISIFLQYSFSLCFLCSVDIFLFFFQIFDALLVLGLFILYITLSHALDDKLGRCVVGFFIVLRLWRFSRVIEGESCGLSEIISCFCL